MKKYTLQKIQGKNLWKCPYCSKTWTTPVADPATRRAKKPLKKDCVKKANDEVKKCDHLRDPKTETTRKIKWDGGRTDSEDYPCRRRWMDEYLACAEQKQDPKKKITPVQPCLVGNLIVYVLDLKNKDKPIPGATVDVQGGKTAETGSKGAAKFNGLPVGFTEVVVGKDEYKDVSTSAFINAGETTEITVKLEKPKLVKKPVQLFVMTFEKTIGGGPHDVEGHKSYSIVFEKYEWVDKEYIPYDKKTIFEEQEELSWRWIMGFMTYSRLRIKWREKTWKDTGKTVTKHLWDIVIGGGLGGPPSPEFGEGIPKLKPPSMVYKSWEEYKAKHPKGYKKYEKYRKLKKYGY